MAVDPKTKLTGPQELFLGSMLFYFRKLGWEPHTIYGLAANIYAETTFRPNLTGDGGHAYGLCQWHGDRQAKFEEVFGIKMVNATVDQQFEFVHWEMFHPKSPERGVGLRLRNAKSAKEAAAIISKYYERPRKDESATRGAFAEALFNRYENPSAKPEG